MDEEWRKEDEFFGVVRHVENVSTRSVRGILPSKDHLISASGIPAVSHSQWEAPDRRMH